MAELKVISMKAENFRCAIVYNGVIKLEGVEKTIVTKYDSVIVEKIVEELGVKYIIKVYRESQSATFVAEVVEYAL